MSPRYLPLTVIGLLFVGMFFWSVWFETLVPLLRAGDMDGVRNHLVGIPVILLGTGTIVYGGYRTLRDMFALTENADFLRHAAIIRARPSPDEVRAAQRAHLHLWGLALRLGLLWMATGFAGIAAGGFIINL